MEELIARVAAAAGINEDLAQTAISVIVNLLNKEGDSDAVSGLLSAIPGASGLLNDGGGESGGVGLLGGLMGAVGAGGMASAMSALSEMKDAGIDQSQAQAAGTELLNVAREKAGDEAVEKVLDSVPMLKQFLG